MRCFYEYLFRQTSAGQHGPAYKFLAAVPGDMWASMNGVCEGNIHCQFWLYILSILGSVLSTSMSEGELVVTEAIVITVYFRPGTA